MEPLLQALLAEGYAVQLAHDEQVTTPQDGFVRVKDASGKVLAENTEYQHNRNFRKRGELTPALLNAVKDSISCPTEVAKEIHDTSDSESSTKASTDGVVA